MDTTANTQILIKITITDAVLIGAPKPLKNLSNKQKRKMIEGDDFDEDLMIISSLLLKGSLLCLNPNLWSHSLVHPMNLIKSAWLVQNANDLQLEKDVATLGPTAGEVLSEFVDLTCD